MQTLFDKMKSGVVHFENQIGQVYRPTGGEGNLVVFRLADKRGIFQDVRSLRINFLNDEEGNRFYRAFVGWCKTIEFDEVYYEIIRNCGPDEKFEEFLRGYPASV